MDTPPFVHLHCHSHYSLLDGASPINSLVSRAKELGMTGLALTDHGNLYGALEFYQKAKDAGINPDQVGYLNAHGTSTPLGDLAETLAIKRALGDHAYKTMVSSTKSMTGHLLGAAGGVEAIFSVLALHHGIIPPTINLFEPGEGCDLDYVPNVARQAQVDVAVSNGFGFGGTNGTLVFKRI